MITVREAAERIVTIQGGGDVDDIARQLQHQLDRYAESIRIITAWWQDVIGYSQRKARRRARIAGQLNKVKHER